MENVSAREMQLESILLGTLERVSLLVSGKVNIYIWGCLKSNDRFTNGWYNNPIKQYRRGYNGKK